MLTKKDAVVGKRVKWQSLDGTIPPTFGTITKVREDGAVEITYDDGEDSGTYINSGASSVYPA